MILTLILTVVLLLNAVVTEAGLRDIAAQHNLTYGCAAGFRALANDASFRAAVSRECGTLTPTTELKMAKVEIDTGVYDFRRSDWVVTYPQTHGITVRGHTLVWYKEIPPWVTTLSPAETRQFLESYITRVMSRYPSITSWDVVNEPVTNMGLQNNLWLQKLGPQYIDLAFRAAARVRPGTQLVLLTGSRPLPLDINLHAKPAYHTLAEVLQRGPSTSVASEGNKSSTVNRTRRGIVGGRAVINACVISHGQVRVSQGSEGV